LSHCKKLAHSALMSGILIVASVAIAQPAHPTTPAPSRWHLVWSDEFNSPTSSTPDPAKWTLVEGGSGYGNQELESYTTRPSNIRVEGGNLVVTAIKEPYTGKDGIARNYTSGRMQSLTHFDFQYGRIEARIKIPVGQGIWPAFWMLGANIDSTPWPDCGEIDIMENVGHELSKVHSTIHGPLYSGGDALTGAYTLSGGQHFTDDFHVFAAEWEPDLIRFYVDGHLFETLTADNIPAYKHWAFNHNFFVLFNLAVGGNWPGPPNDATQFPQQMLVDWVRVYKPGKAK